MLGVACARRPPRAPASGGRISAREGRPNPSRAARPPGAPPDVRTVSGASREHARVRESAGELRGVGVERCGPGGLEGRDRRNGERSEPSRMRTATARRDHRERLGPRTATAGSRELEGAVSRSIRPGGRKHRSEARSAACLPAGRAGRGLRGWMWRTCWRRRAGRGLRRWMWRTCWRRRAGRGLRRWSSLW